MESVKGPDRKEERIERMVLQYQLPLLKLCYAYLHDEELAKDAVQETFIKAYRGLSGFRENASEKTWLSRIAINTCKDLRRTSWFRHVDRAVTLDRLPEPAAPVEPEDERQSEPWRMIMRLPNDKGPSRKRETRLCATAFGKHRYGGAMLRCASRCLQASMTRST